MSVLARLAGADAGMSGAERVRLLSARVAQLEAEGMPPPSSHPTCSTPRAAPSSFLAAAPLPAAWAYRAPGPTHRRVLVSPHASSGWGEAPLDNSGSVSPPALSDSRTHVPKDVSEIPNCRATSLIGLPDDRYNATASRLNSAEYRRVVEPFPITTTSSTNTGPRCPVYGGRFTARSWLWLSIGWLLLRLADSRQASDEHPTANSRR